MAKGTYARIEFILPGKPGRWLAAGEVTFAIEEPTSEIPKGVCLELLGLTLTTVVGPTQSEETAAGVVPELDDQGEPAEAYDPKDLKMDEQDVCGMLSDLMGRNVDAVGDSKLPDQLKGNAVVAVFRDDAGKASFTITFDKGGAARVGGALTMVPEAKVNKEAKNKVMLEGEPLENISEVLNIMSALFHEAGTPHVVLAEVINGIDMREHNDGELVALFDEPRWSLGHSLDIEDYGPGEVYIGAR